MLLLSEDGNKVNFDLSEEITFFHCSRDQIHWVLSNLNTLKNLLLNVLLFWLQPTHVIHFCEAHNGRFLWKLGSVANLSVELLWSLRIIRINVRRYLYEIFSFLPKISFDYEDVSNLSQRLSLISRKDFLIQQIFRQILLR